MSVEIINVEQNTDDWMRARLGLVTASVFSDVLAKGEGKVRAALMRLLAAERLCGEPMETFKSAAMERGHQMEAEAREFYAFMADADPIRVGFVKNGERGCSPDSLIGDNGILEIKTQRGDLLIATLLADRFPSEHVAQCQGALMVTEREWIDLCVFWPKMPPFIRRAWRDEAYIANLSAEVDRFNDELAALVDRIRRYGEPARAAA